MASEYKKRGGDYNTDKSEKDESQKNLTNWGEEDWQTKEGSGHAKQEDGSEKRYLPKKAWENMTEEEKQQTDDKKQEGSKGGKQHVSNTPKARQSRKNATKDGNKEEHKEKDESEPKSEDEAEDYVDDGEAEADEDGEEAAEDGDGADDVEEEEEDLNEEDEEGEDAKAGQKRTRGKTTNKSSKKQKDNAGKSKPNGTVGSKHDSAEEPAPRGSADRLPKKGQKVQWKALPGYVHGEVVEIATENKEFDGKQVKASKSDPRVVLKSSSSGKIAVHKPEAVFFG